MTGKHIKIISLAIIAVFALWGAWSLLDYSADTERESGSVIGELELVIIWPDAEPEIFEVSFEEPLTIFEALLDLEARELITLDYRDFGGELGIFLEAIDGLGGDSDRWWQYWVNNDYSQIGISQRLAEPGDVVRFEYTGELSQ